MLSPYAVPLPEPDYLALEQALKATEKGRRFLRSYLERNRSTETYKVLQSIAKLHRAAITPPGASSSLRCDLQGILWSLAHLRHAVAEQPSEAVRARVLLDGLHAAEASLLTLAETIEENDAENDSATAMNGDAGQVHSLRSAKLFGELSSLFEEEPHFGPRI